MTIANLIIVVVILACILMVVLAVVHQEDSEVDDVINSALNKPPVFTDTKEDFKKRRELHPAVTYDSLDNILFKQKYYNLLQLQKEKVEKLTQWHADKLLDEWLYQSQLKEVTEAIDVLESEIKAQ